MKQCWCKDETLPVMKDNAYVGESMEVVGWIETCIRCQYKRLHADEMPDGTKPLWVRRIERANPKRFNRIIMYPVTKPKESDSGEEKEEAKTANE